MVRLALAEKRDGMNFHALYGNGYEMDNPNIEAFLAIPDIANEISFLEKFNYSWQIYEINPDPKKPNKLLFTKEY